MENSVNYAQDRSAQYRHHVPVDIGPPIGLTAQEYMNNERSKQAAKLRDWYSDAKDGRETVDPVALRANFNTSRRFVTPNPVQELDHHKKFVLLGVAVVAAVGSFIYFIH